MESLADEVWDVVIAGTSVPQALLALSLSKCDVKVLHVDKNEYYGGVDAGLSLDEAQKWANSEPDNAIITLDTDAADALGSSRAYTISLRPQIIYAKSKFLPTLVSSQIHSQLEFQAVGSFWILADGKVQKIPSNREDVFADDSISVRDKRRLMGLLRYVLEEQADGGSLEPPASLQSKLACQFKIPETLTAPIQALTLSTDTLAATDFDSAMVRLRRQLTSMGYFGPGLAAVMPKYGGNSEIAQVACRAGAVGGFVYLLGHGISSIDVANDTDVLTEVQLSDGTKVKAKHVVGTSQTLPASVDDYLNKPSLDQTSGKVAHRTSIISDPLKHLFTATSENGPIPAVAIVLMSTETNDQAPVYLQVHSEDTGECPPGQCVIYASTRVKDDSDHQERLSAAISSVLATDDKGETGKVLWTMSYTTVEGVPISSATSNVGSVMFDTRGKLAVFPERSHDLAFDDSVLNDVKVIWEKVLGDASKEYDFLRFPERQESNDD